MLHRVAVACVAVALFAGLSASRAKADSTNVVTATTVDDFDFTISGNTYTWTTTVPPAIINAGETSFDLADTSYTFNGQSTSASFIEFYTASDLGGFLLEGGAGPYLDIVGPSLFNDTPTTAPVFALGIFNDDFTNLLTGAVGSLAVTQTTVSNTPEPGTLLLTGIGLLALAWVARKRKKQFSLAS
jgi:hypothetical protein